MASLPVAIPAHANPAQESAHYLFVWTGDSAKTGNNFVVVVDADPNSPTYGK